MKLEEMSNADLNNKLHRLVNKIPEDHEVLIRPIYCIDWNATMPLAVEHGISVISDGDDYEVSYDYYAPVGKFETDELLSECCSVSKKDVLRAIIICLIKVLEAE